MQRKIIIFILLLFIGAQGVAAVSVKNSENISFISSLKKRWNCAVKRYNAAVDKDTVAMLNREEQIDEPVVESQVQEELEEKGALSDAEKLNFVFKFLYKKKKKSKRSWFGFKPSYVSHAAWAAFAIGLTYVLKKSYDALSTKEGQKSFTEHVTAAAVDGAFQGLGNHVGDEVVDKAKQEVPELLKHGVGVVAAVNRVANAYNGVMPPEQPEPAVAAKERHEEPPKITVSEGLPRVAEYLGGEGAKRNVEIALAVVDALVAPQKQLDAEAEDIAVVPEKKPEEVAQELVDTGKAKLIKLQEAAGNVEALVDDFNSAMSYYRDGKQYVRQAVSETKGMVHQLGEEIVTNQSRSTSWIPWLGVKALGSYVAGVNYVSKRLGFDKEFTEEQRKEAMNQYNARIAAKALKGAEEEQ